MKFINTDNIKNTIMAGVSGKLAGKIKENTKKINAAKGTDIYEAIRWFRLLTNTFSL